MGMPPNSGTPTATPTAATGLRAVVATPPGAAPPPTAAAPPEPPALPVLALEAVAAEEVEELRAVALSSAPSRTHPGSGLPRSARPITAWSDEPGSTACAADLSQSDAVHVIPAAARVRTRRGARRQRSPRAPHLSRVADAEAQRSASVTVQAAVRGWRARRLLRAAGMPARAPPTRQPPHAVGGDAGATRLNDPARCDGGKLDRVRQWRESQRRLHAGSSGLPPRPPALPPNAVGATRAAFEAGGDAAAESVVQLLSPAAHAAEAALQAAEERLEQLQALAERVRPCVRPRPRHRALTAPACAQLQTVRGAFFDTDVITGAPARYRVAPLRAMVQQEVAAQQCRVQAARAAGASGSAAQPRSPDGGRQ